MFDHTKNDLVEACGTDVEAVKKAFDTLPNRIRGKSELIELMCRAGDDPAQNLAIWFAYFAEAHAFAQAAEKLFS